MFLITNTLLSIVQKLSINPYNAPLKIVEFEHRALTHCAKSNYLNVLLDAVNFNPLI